MVEYESTKYLPFVLRFESENPYLGNRPRAISYAVIFSIQRSTKGGKLNVRSLSHWRVFSGRILAGLLGTDIGGSSRDGYWRVFSGRIFRSELQNMTYILIFDCLGLR
jgi:hypothetical protein